jgi:hypothetical protein
MKPIYLTPSPISPFTLSPPTSTPTHTYTLYLCYSPVFHYQYFSWCSIGCLNICPLWVYFILSVHPLPLLSLTLYLLPPFFNSFQYTYLYLLPLHLMWYYWCSNILFSLPSFSEFYRVVPPLQTCSTSEIVYVHAYFCVYFHLIDISPMYKRKHVAFLFLSLAYFT